METELAHAVKVKYVLSKCPAQDLERCYFISVLYYFLDSVVWMFVSFCSGFEDIDRQWRIQEGARTANTYCIDQIFLTS